ncbi:hypothetical protein F7725_022014 [Dissostichus mawsoni]|uniref:Uncharacterized protein n=1 Tax=Dissostichus mawsoni TaxID=36200 RepID=A0A7J5ZCR7_DISMA|nr:hypothetical protein F7725_022014 [Dissostichus mawsoni]
MRDIGFMQEGLETSVVLPHHVVVDVARVAQLVDRLPVLVQRAVALSRRIHQVLCKLFELHIGTVDEGFLGRILAVAPDDTGAETLVKGRVVLEGELVAVSGDQPLEGLADEEELEVVLEAVVDLGDTVLVQRLQVGRDVGFVGRDFHRVFEVCGSQDSSLTAGRAVGSTGINDLVPPSLVQDGGSRQLRLFRETEEKKAGEYCDGDESKGTEEDKGEYYRYSVFNMNKSTQSSLICDACDEEEEAGEELKSV